MGRAAGWVLTGRGPGLERNPTSTSFSNMNQQTRLECQQLFDVYKACKKAHRERVIQERLDARGGTQGRRAFRGDPQGKSQVRSANDASPIRS